MHTQLSEHHVAKPVFLSSTPVDHRNHKCLHALQQSRKTLATNIRKDTFAHMHYLYQF